MAEVSGTRRPWPRIERRSETVERPKKVSGSGQYQWGVTHTIGAKREAEEEMDRTQRVLQRRGKARQRVEAMVQPGAGESSAHIVLKMPSGKVRRQGCFNT